MVSLPPSTTNRPCKTHKRASANVAALLQPRGFQAIGKAAPANCDTERAEISTGTDVLLVLTANSTYTYRCKYAIGVRVMRSCFYCVCSVETHRWRQWLTVLQPAVGGRRLPCRPALPLQPGVDDHMGVSERLHPVQVFHICVGGKVLKLVAQIPK